MSLKEENNKRFRKLNKEQKKQLRNNLITMRVGSLVVINIFTFLTVGVVVGLLGWLLLMVVLDKYLVKMGLDTILQE